MVEKLDAEHHADFERYVLFDRPPRARPPVPRDHETAARNLTHGYGTRLVPVVRRVG